MVWGDESTSGQLFVSTESVAEEPSDGFHTAYNVGTNQILFDFDAKESGDAIALHPDCKDLIFLPSYIYLFRCL